MCSYPNNQPEDSRPSRWRYTEAELAAAVEASRSFRETLARLGLSKQGGGAYATIKRRIALLGLDTSHFLGRGWSAGSQRGEGCGRPLPLASALVEESPVKNPGRLKQRLIRLGLLDNRCDVCALPPWWEGKPLVLRLDHTNGIRNDNRIENLRLVCPNCDSQLPTFAGRNSRKGVRLGD